MSLCFSGLQVFGIGKLSGVSASCISSTSSSFVIVDVIEIRPLLILSVLHYPQHIAECHDPITQLRKERGENTVSLH